MSGLVAIALVVVLWAGAAFGSGNAQLAIAIQAEGNQSPVTDDQSNIAWAEAPVKWARAGTARSPRTLGT